MERIIIAIIVLASVYLGYLMGKGETIKLPFKKFKPIIRTDEQESKLVEKLRSKK